MNHLQKIEDFKQEIQQIFNDKTIELRTRKSKIKLLRQLILYLETKPSENAIKKEIDRQFKKIETRAELIELIKNPFCTINRSKKELKEDLAAASYSENRFYLKNLRSLLN